MTEQSEGTQTIWLLHAPLGTDSSVNWNLLPLEFTEALLNFSLSQFWFHSVLTMLLAQLSVCTSALRDSCNHAGHGAVSRSSSAFLGPP